MRLSISVVVALIALFVVPLSANADTIFSSFITGDTYSPSAWAIIGSGQGFYQRLADSFTPSADYFFDSAVFPFVSTQQADAFVVDLMSDAGGLPSDVSLETLVVSVSSEQIYTVSSISHPFLSSGMTYWLVVSPAYNYTSGGWYNNQLDNSGFAGSHSSSGGWYFQSDTHGQGSPAFRVEGTVIPEPTSLLLLGTGLGILWLGANRRRRK